MDLRTRNYLITAQTKVITHCRAVLKASSISELERRRVESCLQSSQKELEMLMQKTNVAAHAA